MSSYLSLSIFTLHYLLVDPETLLQGPFLSSILSNKQVDIQTSEGYAATTSTTTTVIDLINAY